MKLSVIIPTYNRCECLKAALNSLLVQEEIEPGDFEVLVVDNNSTDNTKTIVGSFEKNFNGRMKYIFEQKQGVAHAINAGIIASKGELVATIGDDCRVDTKWAAKIRSVFETKNIDLLAGKIIARFDGPLPPWIDLSKLHGPLAHYDKGEHYLESTKDRRIIPTGANTILRRAAIDAYGAYRPAGRAEDTELGVRWQSRGAKIAYSPDVVVYHYNESARLTKQYFRKWFFLCGKNWFLIFKEKYRSGRLFLKVPLWVYKELLQCVVKYVRSLAGRHQRETFFHEAIICYYCGIIWGCFGLNTNFENLR